MLGRGAEQSGGRIRVGRLEGVREQGSFTRLEVTPLPPLPCPLYSCVNLLSWLTQGFSGRAMHRTLCPNSGCCKCALTCSKASSVDAPCASATMAPKELLFASLFPPACSLFSLSQLSRKVQAQLQDGSSQLSNSKMSYRISPPTPPLLRFPDAAQQLSRLNVSTLQGHSICEPAR